VFERSFIAGWGDMDFNSHMRNTAFLDKSGDLRLMFFASCGFPISEFQRLRLGPLAMKDELEYRREFNLHDEVRATLKLAGLRDDGSRVMWRNDFYRGDTLAAQVTTLSGWLDLGQRTLVPPPLALLDAIRDLPHSDDFTVLPDRTG
jgi:acyl-CoA thioester hydrolase